MQVLLDIIVIPYFPVLGFQFFSLTKYCGGRCGLCLFCSYRIGLAKKEMKPRKNM